MSQHLSFSALKAWSECPHRFKILWDDRSVRFPPSIHMSFGTAMHAVAEAALLETGLPVKEQGQIDYDKLFLKTFKRELIQIPEDSYSEQMIFDMVAQARTMYSLIIPALNDYFPDGFEVHSAEEQLMEPITEFEAQLLKFKGFIDLVLKTPDGKYHIIDWKTCSWGWKARKKSDPMMTYQLTLYKHFWCRKYDIDPQMVETHFALLKRTAKKDNVEPFRVTSGARKTTNALKVLTDACHSFTKKFYPKNKLSCKWCDLKNTEWCP